MKRCPECRRDYYDETLLHCLDDGTPLLEGPASGSTALNEPATAIFPTADAVGDAPTRAQIHTTESTAVLPTNISLPQSKRKVSGGQLAVLIGIVAVLGIAGFFGYRYFLSGNAKQIESIAVMPFVNESGNPDVEYLSDGMTETLISSLSQLPNLDVKPRSSVFRYKGKETDPQTVGKELSVQAVLNGRVTQRGQDISLYIELIDVGRNKTVWSDTYNSKESDLVRLQSDIARDVSGKLKTKLSATDEAKVTKSYTTDPKAFELYLKGRYFSRQFTLDGFHKGVEAFNQAISLDPNYALAYAGLSDAYFYASTIRLPPTEALPKVGEYAQKALAIDDSLAAAHHSIANYKANYQRDNDGAKREYERALALDPTDASIYLDYSQLLANIGESDRSISVAKKGKTADPQDTYGAGTLAQAFVLAGRKDEALAESEATIRLDDKNWWGYYWRGLALSGKGMPDEAVAALQTASRIDDSPLISGVLAALLARAGRRAEAQHVIDELIAASKTKFVSQTSIAMGYVGLGENDRAFEWLDKSLESHDEQIIWIYRHPMFAPLRNDRRYSELLKKLNLANKEQ